MNAQKTSSFIEKNKSAFVLAIIVLISLGLLYFVLFTNKKIAQFVPGLTPAPTPKMYKTLSDELNTIINSTNPKATAQKAGLAVTGNGVNVVIILKDVDMKAKNQFFFLPIYGTQQIRYSNTIQAVLLFDKIETVAKNPQVISITGVKKPTLTPGVDINIFKKK